MSEAKVLVVDADEQRLETLGAILRFIDYAPVLVTSLAHLSLEGRRPQDWLAVIVGQEDDQQSLARFAEWLKRDRLHPPLLVLAKYHEKLAESLGLDRSACLPLEYPVKYSHLSDTLKRAGLVRDETPPAAAAAVGPTGNSMLVRRTRRMIEQVAPHDSTVLITGESGTGKEVVARAVHTQSNRRDRPFVAVNCGAIPSELLESELFGHEKGAFTGAITARRGRFEMAEGGTLFLDEIGDMSLPMQVKILRVLQERTYERVGASRSLHCDVRIIAATHRNLEEAIVKGSFREDLFYRLNVFPIEMPPLRERLEDLPLLIDELIAAQERNGHGGVRLAADAVHSLRAYHWPGNVRELSNLVERLAVLHPDGVVSAAELPLRYRGQGGVVAPAPAAVQPSEDEQPSLLPLRSASVTVLESTTQLPQDGIDLKDYIEAIEISLIRQALQNSCGVVAHAAKLLNTRRTTLVEKLRKYGLHRDFVEREQLKA
ncbi:MAG: sigma-54 dependent transcriptional regulator [Nevskia sp.]|nr:sigma-54 dependent transcriptional regulator [Nevskia sp.]